MFAHALPQGSLRSAEALPPTLIPNAIHAMAPPAPRRMGFLGACVVYASCALAMTLAPNLSGTGIGKPKTGNGGFVVPPDPPRINVELNPVKPPEPVHFRAMTHSNAPERDKNWVPPVSSNVVPDKVPETLPTQSHFMDSMQKGDSDSNAKVPLGAHSGEGTDPGGSYSAPTEFTFSQMRILQQVNPVYPAMARLAKVQGDVVLLMTVDPHGVPTDVKTLSGPHPSLEQEAMRVARLWRFEPASLNGQAVSAQFRLTILFRLK